ncbi:DUF4398 domain-containing protein [Marinicella litoralis]|uniref:Uncharacterized protein DUF4398 n=1 Tax=Marinicella litoralis TaxID=644220 RepID=A0A4R6XVD9_9GAMM|nr:DUF4398 domain-containing protein [Marinicella litoralis]TDR22519.1 uncharacterized protein DUF4398 [Marinicella litoralis]
MQLKLILPLAFAMTTITLPAFADRDASNKAINQAKVLIESAERNGASMHASFLLKSSRDNLNKAMMQLDKRDWVEAEVSAKMAQRDAEVADAKSQAAKAEKSYTDLKASVDILKAELDRKRSMQ